MFFLLTIVLFVHLSTIYPNVSVLEKILIAIICFGILGFMESNEENN